MKNPLNTRIAQSLALAAMFVLPSCSALSGPANPNSGPANANARKFVFQSEPAGAEVQFSVDGGARYTKARTRVTPSQLYFTWPANASHIPVQFRVKWPDGIYSKVLTVRKADGSVRMRWTRRPVAKNSAGGTGSNPQSAQAGGNYETAFTNDQ